MVAYVGITSGFDPDRQTYVSHSAYALAIEIAGGVPLILPYLGSSLDPAQILGQVDGIVLAGGTDLDPRLYGDPMHPNIESIIPERDRFELVLTAAALRDDAPVLGICRGMQTLNVVGGGSLYPDIPSCLPRALNHRDGTPITRMAHSVAIEPGSRLASLCGVPTLEVNSWHHQAVNAIGPIFRVSARAPDDIVEAIESRQHRFAVGVQWHPERLYHQDPVCQRLFEEFVRACETRSIRRG